MPIRYYTNGVQGFFFGGGGGDRTLPAKSVPGVLGENKRRRVGKVKNQPTYAEMNARAELDARSTTSLLAE